MFSKKFVAASRTFSTFKKFVNAPYLRKDFSLDSLPKKAVLTLCGLGFYRLWVNGEEITKGFLAPYISNPDDILYYDSYDVTALLKKGKNVFAFLLGNGFLNNAGGAVWDMDKASFRSAPKLAFSFEMDGVLSFEANTSIKTHDSPIIFDDLRAGERYDANLEISHWNECDFDDSSWKGCIEAVSPKGEARLCRADPILINERLTPKEIRKLNDGSYLYVFPKNSAGFAKISFFSQKNQRVSIDFGELLLNGDLNMDNIGFGERTPKGFNQHIEFIGSGKEETYIPSFCYFGYQYAKVSGINEKQAVPSFLTMLVARSDYKHVASFSSSEERMNRLYNMAINSMDSNFFYFPTDCPHREKNGWTGDIALSADYFCWSANLKNSLKEWLHNVMKAQLPSGAIPGIIPTTGWGFGFGSGPAWDIALFEIPYSVYQYERDDSILREAAPAMEKYLCYAKTKEDEKGLLSYGLGDWCETNRVSGDFKTPLWITDTLTCIMMAEKAEMMFHIIGFQAQEELAKDLKKHWIDAFRNSFFFDGKIDPRVVTQTSLAMLLESGILSEEEDQWIFELLLELIHKNHDHFQVGVLGARRLWFTLTKHGEISLALKLIEQDSYPSFGYLDSMRETSLWEEFITEFEKEKDGSLKTKNPHFYSFVSSLNHHFWGSFIMIFVNYVAGIQINPDLKEEILISPCFPDGITHAEASRIYLGHEIKTSWKRDTNRIRLEYVVPKNIKVRLLKKEGFDYEIIEKRS